MRGGGGEDHRSAKPDTELFTKMKSSSSINVSGGRRSSGSSAPFPTINIGQNQMVGGCVSSSGWTADTAILVEDEEVEESEGEESSGDDSHEQKV